MNQSKTGKFIAQLRKEKEITQKQLAEKLGVSDKAVSRWECGKGFPDVSLLLPICKIFEINANELLAGERLDEKEYHKKAEEHIVELVKKADYKKTVINILISILLFIIPFGFIFLAAGKIIPTIIMPIVFFINLLLVVGNFIAGLVYGIIKKWSRWTLACIVLLNIFVIYVMTVILYMMILAFYVAG